MSQAGRQRRAPHRGSCASPEVLPGRTLESSFEVGDSATNLGEDVLERPVTRVVETRRDVTGREVLRWWGGPRVEDLVRALGHLQLNERPPRQFAPEPVRPVFAIADQRDVTPRLPLLVAVGVNGCLLRKIEPV